MCGGHQRCAARNSDLKLGTLAAHYGVRQRKAHDALDDVRVLVGVLSGSLAAAADLGIDLPLVTCPPKQGTDYPPSVPKTPCAFRNPGRLPAGGPLVQGMKVAFTGDSRLSRRRPRPKRPGRPRTHSIRALVLRSGSLSSTTGEPDAGKPACPVRGGAARKRPQRGHRAAAGDK